MTSPEARKWKAAANEEFRSLKKKGAIELIRQSKIPMDRKAMKSKWVFKRKYDVNGKVERHKARCTVKGYTQRKGIDYQETFTPKPKPETGRNLLVLAHQLGWHRRQGDVPAAFLNPDLKVDLYMEIPQGFEKQGYLIKIRKGLFGLKQATALWYDGVRATLSKHGLHPTISDICLYTNSQKSLFALMYVYDF